MINPTLEIAISKTKLSLLFIGAIVFVAIAIWLIADPAALDKYSFGFEKGVVFIWGIIALVAFGAITIFITIKLFDKKPGLIISDEGIMDASSSVAVGFINWYDVTNISNQGVSGQLFITIEVANPNEYIQKFSGLKRTMLSANYKLYKSPINITSHALKGNIDDIYALILKYWKSSQAK
jgi:hypothetical protein